jgi:hypothetical protein
VLEGDSDTLINDPEVKKAYLGGIEGIFLKARYESCKAEVLRLS